MYYWYMAYRGKEYPIEADKALRRNGECFPFNISDIETL